jgi:DNA-binding NtrC family response regulator
MNGPVPARQRTRRIPVSKIQSIQRRVLVAEDEPDLHSVIEHILKPFGCEIQFETQIDRAVKAVLKNRYDLIVADHTFGQSAKNGLDLFNLCEQKIPGVPFVLMSGFPADVFDSLVKLGKSLPPFLSKPFSVAECRGILEKAIASEPDKSKAA